MKRHTPYRAVIACGLAALGWLISTNVLACRGPFRSEPTLAQSFANADLVLTGRVVSLGAVTSYGLQGARMEVAGYLKGAGARTLHIYFSTVPSPCGGPMTKLAVGDWWTIYIHRDPTSGLLSVGKLEAFCEPGAVPVSAAPAGHCARLLTQATRVGPLVIDAGSTVTLGPDRSIGSIRSARLKGRSGFAGVVLPPDTVWLRENQEYRLPSAVNIGPVQVKGQVTLAYAKGDSEADSAYFIGLAPRQTGSARLDGVEVTQVKLAEPGFALRDVTYASPATINGK